MTRTEAGIRSVPRREGRCYLIALLCLAILGPLSSQAAPPTGGTADSLLPAPEQSFTSGKDIVLYPPDHGRSSFRFLPAGVAVPFDRSIVLSAAPGEERAYLVQVSPDKSGHEASSVSG